MSLSPVVEPPDLVKYRLLNEIGHGGMATVYRALDLRLGREVAVKLIHPHLRQNQEAAARFVTEARAVAKLRHPGIVEIFDISDEKEPERYLVAELIRGPSLRKVLKDHGAVPPEVAGCVGLLLCDALAHAHDAGIVHRDVKPENVLVEFEASVGDAAVKLTDFGIAKLIDAQGVTATGQVLGSPAHMAPEQIEGGQVDPRTDIFSVGVLLYECVVGHLPFEGKNPAQVLRRVLEGVCSAPDKERPVVGAQWSSLILRALAKEPDDRYSSAREMAAAIRVNLEGAGIENYYAEVWRYLQDAAHYEREFAPKIVAMLVSRAEKGRAAGNVRGAADDLNRAIAYVPEDAELVRRVANLAQGVRRKKALRYAVAIVVPFTLLSAGTFAVVSSVRAKQKAAALAGVSLAAPDASVAQEPISAEAPAGSAAIGAVGEPSGGRPTVKIPRLPFVEAPRPVEIKATPQSALVSIDGASPVAVGFDGIRTTLRPGGHALVFSVTKETTCCEGLTAIFDVKASEPATKTQFFSARLPYRDARLSFFGGPADARLACPGNSASLKSGQQVNVKMTKPFEQFSCFLGATGTAPSERQVVLRAGEPTIVS